MKKIFLFFGILFSLSLFSNPRIMVTGFWNPTGDMVRAFCTDENLNPEGWIGSNWEDRGFDIYSYFPGYENYTGDFEVDYQDTWADFYAITDTLNPVAIISFGLGNGPWEIEYNARNLNNWVSDGTIPYYPDQLPPDSNSPINYVRNSSLPVEFIEESVDSLGVNAWIDWNGDPGRYLCEFMAYLGMWYRDDNIMSFDRPCLAAGFIHANDSNTSQENLNEATLRTIRRTIDYIDLHRPVTINVSTNGATITGTYVNVQGDNDYQLVLDSDNVAADFPYIPEGEYQISAIKPGSFFTFQDIEISQSQTNFDLNMEQLEQSTDYNYLNGDITLENINGVNSCSIASRFSASLISSDIGDIIGKISFVAPNSSNNCDLKVQLYSSSPSDNQPIDLLYENIPMSFNEGEEVQILLEEPIFIEDEKDYWVTYEIATDDNNVGWITDGPTIEDLGAWYYNGSYWSPYNNLTGVEGNWTFKICTYTTAISPIIEEEVIPIIADISKLKSYPNPFSYSNDRANMINISFNLAQESRAIIDLYNLRGQKIKSLENRYFAKGSNSIVWNGRDEKGNNISSGIYFYKVKTNSSQKVGKLLIIK